MAEFAVGLWDVMSTKSSHVRLFRDARPKQRGKPIMLPNAKSLGLAMLVSTTSAYAYAYQSPSQGGVVSGVEAETPRAGAQLEEIVVTATRREERLQEVPISVSAVTSEALAASGATDVRQVMFAVPGFTGGRNFGVLQPSQTRGATLRSGGTSQVLTFRGFPARAGTSFAGSGEASWHSRQRAHRMQRLATRRPQARHALAEPLTAPPWAGTR